MKATTEELLEASKNLPEREFVEEQEFLNEQATKLRAIGLKPYMGYSGALLDKEESYVVGGGEESIEVFKSNDHRHSIVVGKKLIYVRANNAKDCEYWLDMAIEVYQTLNQ